MRITLRTPKDRIGSKLGPLLKEPFMNNPVFATLKEAFLYCRDMDASLQERLETFSEATRYLIPGYQEAVDRMVDRTRRCRYERGCHA